jgi:drug/metabolite transporter (DMT)-like permease
VTALQAIATMKALQTGPMSYSNVIISSATLITALSGYFFFDETIEWPQYVGIALMFASFFLAIEKEKGGKGTSLRWMAFCLLAFGCSGSVGIMQKIESTHHKDELGTFLVLAFVMATLFSGILALLLWRKAKKDVAKGGTPDAPLLTKSGLKTLLIPGCMILMGIAAAILAVAIAL